MTPSDAEVVFWCVAGLIVAGVLLWGMTHAEPDMEMSDYWKNRYIHGRK